MRKLDHHESSNGNLTEAHLESNMNDMNIKPISKYRKALPQFLATSAVYLNLFDMGMALGFPTIMLPALRSGEESVMFNEGQASWFASLMFIFQPVGSVLSSFLLTYFGRKNCLILINIPFFVIWVLIHLSESIPILMLSSVVLALNIGFCETPAINYVGEISTPKLRGILTSYSAPIIYMGIIFEFILGKFYHWRTVAIINSTIPLLTIASMIQIPESPMWLLSKGRTQRAKVALCWLRGWVNPELVMTEFKYLLKYKEESSSKNKLMAGKIYTVEKSKQNLTSSESLTKYRQDFIDVPDCTGLKNVKYYNVSSADFESFNQSHHKSGDSWTIMFRPEYVKPFILVSMYFFFYYMCGISSVRPYLLLVIKEMNIPVDKNLCAIFVPTTGLVGSIVSMCIIKRIGKRPLSLISIAGSAFGALACGVLSYRHTSEPQILPFIMFLVLAFFTALGIAAIPWMLLSEVFPLKGRGIASGITATVAYSLAFVTAKTFLDLEHWLGLHGVFFLYGSCSVFGLIYLYLWLPETEGKTLHEIELYFKEKQTRKKQQITDDLLVA